MITITIPTWVSIVIVVLLILDFVNRVLEIIQWKLDRDIDVFIKAKQKGADDE